MTLKGLFAKWDIGAKQFYNAMGVSAYHFSRKLADRTMANSWHPEFRPSELLKIKAQLEELKWDIEDAIKDLPV